MVLGSAGLGIAGIGLTYLFVPHLLLDVYGFHIQSPSEANIFRSGFEGLFVALAILFCLGAANPRYTRTSLVTMFAFMSGLAVGRLVSIVADGWPLVAGAGRFAAHTPPAGHGSSHLPNTTTIASAPALHHLDQESQ
jgi:hypothetical protein